MSKKQINEGYLDCDCQQNIEENFNRMAKNKAQPDLSVNDESDPAFVKGVIRQESLPDGYPYINTEYEYRLEEQSYTTKNSYAARASKEFTIPWFSNAEGEKIIVKYDGQEFELEVKSYDNDHNGIGDPALVIYQYEYSKEIPFYIKLRKTSVASTAVVYVYTGEESHSLAAYTKSSVPVPLDEKFIPPLYSVILKSSTEGSSKKFKVTVDDSGTLSATEITG